MMPSLLLMTDRSGYTLLSSLLSQWLTADHISSLQESSVHIMCTSS